MPYNISSNFDCALDLAHCALVLVRRVCVYVCFSVMIGGYCVRHARPRLAACCCGFDTDTAAKAGGLLACELYILYA